jgi:CRP/FNR family cyclic AMP-dependent transcriptional regulator
MLKRTDLVRAIQSIPWFIDMQSDQIERLAGIAGIRSLEAGEVLFLEGDREVYMYIILDGQINLENYVPTHGVLYLYTADPLDILGWSSMTPVVRQLTATARALCPSKLLAFDSDALKRLCEEDHAANGKCGRFPIAGEQVGFIRSDHETCPGTGRTASDCPPQTGSGGALIPTFLVL